MSGNGNNRETDREIVIVRRSAPSEGEGHHGGVWKIAYADFMTAMMAFFLVMWLVNAANEETKAAVASYFNPIELLDRNPADRSIRDETEPSQGATPTPAPETLGQGATDNTSEESGRDQETTAGEKTDYSQADYFENPYAVLSEIALAVGEQANVSEAGEGGAQTSGPSSGASGGEAYRDPFDPDFWSQELAVDEAGETMAVLEDTPVAPLADNAQSIATEKEAETAVEALQAVENAGGDAEGAGEAGPDEPQVAAAPPAEITEEPAPVEPADIEQPNDAAMEEAEAAATEAAARLRDDIEQAIAGIDGRLADGLEVTPAEGGLLVSLTDQLEYGMFNIGSAVPKRDLVLAMERIGQLLAERSGMIVIRGHTDARPFEGGGDNWRLSTDRAHSAFYMLVRGGLARERIVQISGYADRRLKMPDDPFAAANRRIEILVEGGEG